MDYQIPANTHVVLATPAYGGMCNIAFTSSCADWAAFHEQHKLKWTTIFCYNEALIQRARNHLVTQFLKIPTATHLLFVDADISFRVEDYVRMIAADKDIIVGSYTKKQIRWDSVLRAAQAGADRLDLYASDHVIDLIEGQQIEDINQPVKIEHGGTGFMLIKRSVFEKLAKNTKTYVKSRQQNQDKDYNFFSVEIERKTNLLLSEDYYFCKEWRKIGGDIWCAPWVELIHWGTHPFMGQLLSKA